MWEMRVSRKLQIRRISLDWLSEPAWGSLQFTGPPASYCRGASMPLKIPASVLWSRNYFNLLWDRALHLHVANLGCEGIIWYACTTSQKQISAFLSGPWPYVYAPKRKGEGREGSAFIFPSPEGPLCFCPSRKGSGSCCKLPSFPSYRVKLQL